MPLLCWPPDSLWAVVPWTAASSLKGQEKGGHSISPRGLFCCWLLSQFPNVSIKVLPGDSWTTQMTQHMLTFSLNQGCLLSEWDPLPVHLAPRFSPLPSGGIPVSSLLVQDHSMAHLHSVASWGPSSLELKFQPLCGPSRSLGLWGKGVAGRRWGRGVERGS